MLGLSCFTQVVISSMNNDQIENQLAVFDSLLDELGSLTEDAKASPQRFMERSIQVCETLLNPEWVAYTSGNSSNPFILACSEGKQEQVRVEVLGPEVPESVIRVQIVTPDGEWGTIWVKPNGLSNSSAAREVVRGIAEMGASFISKYESANKQTSSEINQFALSAHRDLDLDGTGARLANDMRVLLGCERVSLFALQAASVRLLSVSSVSKVEERTELSRRLKQMADWSARNQEAIFSDQLGLPAAIAHVVARHVESTDLPFLVCLPIQNPSTNRLAGCLIAEATAQLDRVRFSQGLRKAMPHVGLALTNAKTLNDIPFHGVLQRLGSTTQWMRLSKMMVGLLILGACSLASVWFQTDFEIRVVGELRPVIEQEVYAPVDGQVERIFVEHEQRVGAEQVLVQLRSIELENQKEQLVTELLQLRQLKEAKEIAFNQIANSQADPVAGAKIASEIADLKFQFQLIEEDIRYVDQQLGLLRIVSPISGAVTTWKVGQRLLNKPVSKGEPIVEIADMDGPWEIRFQVPERKIGYMLNQQERTGEPAQIEVFLDSEPDNKVWVEVESIAKSTSRSEDGEAVTLVTCRAPETLIDRRQGASISGNVDCGRTSYLDSWTREMVDSVKRRFVW